MEKIPTLLVMSLCCAAIGCSGGSKELSRKAAADLISHDKEFLAPFYVEIPVGRLDMPDWAINRFDFPGLKKDGILTLRETGNVEKVWHKEYLVELTPLGQREMANWVKTSELVIGNTSGPDAILYKAPVGQREITQVTGLQNMTPDNKSFRCFFDWKWAPKPQGQALPSHKMPTEIYHGVALFELYDDGWRISGWAFND
jgi:hypothetical protein